MKHAIASVAALGLLLVGEASHAASFDCTRAQSKIEKAVCANPDVSDLDEYLGRYYAGASEALKDGSSCLKADQRTWVKSVRDACGTDAKCLRKTYLARLSLLDGLQPGVTQLKSIDLPAGPVLITTIPPEIEAAASNSKKPMHLTGKLLHETADLYQMGLAVKPDTGKVRAFVLDINIGNSVNHDIVQQLIATEPNGRFTVRGMATAEGNFAEDRCRFVYRAP